MKTALTNLAVATLWVAGGLIVLTPFGVAGLALAYGELGLAAVIFCLGLLQAMVIATFAANCANRAPPRHSGRELRGY